MIRFNISHLLYYLNLVETPAGVPKAPMHRLLGLGVGSPFPLLGGARGGFPVSPPGRG